MGIRDHMGEYDHVRCPTCGVPWLKHDEACRRHPYRPMADIAAHTSEQILPLLFAPEMVRARERGAPSPLPRIG